MPPDLEDLGKKLDKMRTDSHADDKKHIPGQENSNSNDKDNRPGADFLATVIAGGIVGYLVDRFAGTMPWGLIAFIILGFIAGVVKANKAMNNTKK